jgi:UDP-N-acetylmuramate--alanine ligase
LDAGGSYTLIDDYGHHPVEMAATLEAARGAFPGRRLVLAFQPHRYTRTRDCFGDFVAVLRSFDALVLTEIYPAGEARIAGADGKSLLQATIAKESSDESSDNKNGLSQNAAVFVSQVAEIPTVLKTVLRANDVLITMGAGSIASLPLLLSEAHHG